MFQSLKRYWLPLSVVVIVLLGVFCINCFCVDDHDTLAYAFAGNNSGFDTTHRVAP